MTQGHVVLDGNVLRLFMGLQQRNSGYLARQELKYLLDKLRLDPRRLEPFGFKVYSQGDEDGVLEEIFRRIGVSRGRFVEIGVENGLECNSLYLLHKGWSGLWIEGNSAQESAIRNKFKIVLDSGRLQLKINFVYPSNVNDLICSHAASTEEIDFLSIDIDGNDYYILDALNLKPKVICIEYNSKFPANIFKVPAFSEHNVWRGTDWMGASLLALSDLARSKGYRLVGTNITGANAFFVREDLVSDHFATSASVDELYNPPRYWLIFDHFHHIGHPADFGPYTDFLD